MIRTLRTSKTSVSRVQSTARRDIYVVMIYAICGGFYRLQLHDSDSMPCKYTLRIRSTSKSRSSIHQHILYYIYIN